MSLMYVTTLCKGKDAKLHTGLCEIEPRELRDANLSKKKHFPCIFFTHFQNFMAIRNCIKNLGALLYFFFVREFIFHVFWSFFLNFFIFLFDCRLLQNPGQTSFEFHLNMRISNDGGLLQGPNDNCTTVAALARSPTSKEITISS